MRVEARFAQGRDPYAGIEFTARESRLVEKDGTVRATFPIVAPADWGQVAVDMLAQKYARRAGVPSATVRVPEEGVPEWLWRSVPAPGAAFGGETDARALFDRLAYAWGYWGWKLGYFKAEGEGAEAACRVFVDELRYMLAHQMASPNSPAWFGHGRYWAYGTTGADCGLWAITADGAGVERVRTMYERPQVHACFLLSLDDTLLGERGIMDFATREARLFKSGSGSGANYSKLRGRGEPLSGGGKSSGLMSFLPPIDSFAGSIKSGGADRRAARMVVLDLDHPDVEEFVGWKAREEAKVGMLVAGAKAAREVLGAAYAAKAAGDAAALKAALAEARERGVPLGLVLQAAQAAEQGAPAPGLPTMTADWDSAAYETVTGQNANNSVRVPDAFMRAVETDGDWRLFWRTELEKAKAEGREPQPCKTLKARDLWDQIARAAWACADPGVHFPDTINAWHTTPEDGEIRTSNPCCLTGETLVDTSEGRVRIDRLTELSAAGAELPYVFCYDTAAGRPALRRIKRAWCSGHTDRLVRVTTDKGVTITCTPDHRFLTWKGEYVAAAELKPGQALRKVSRHANARRSNRVMITDPKCGNDNGTEYQSLWMWEQANGPVPAGHEVHHKNEDPTDDRLSNLELVERGTHRSLHAAGDANARWIDSAQDDLFQVYDYLTDPVNRDGRYRGTDVTVARWNYAVRTLNLTGKVPIAASVKGGRIRGMAFSDFVRELAAARSAANDQVVAVELVHIKQGVPVYDTEVDGVCNFGVSNSAERGTHSLVVHNSEYLHLDDTACNLACLNLVAFDAPAGYKVADLEHAARVWTIVLDVNIGMAGYPSEAIAEGSRLSRTIGLGYANLGALIMRQGAAYDSDAGRGWAACLTGLVHFTAARTSVELARELGSFPRHEANKVHVRRVLGNHAAYLTDQKYAGLNVTPPDPTDWLEAVPDHVCAAAVAAAELALIEYEAAGALRNAQLSLVQPAGTCGLQMSCFTSDTLVAVADGRNAVSLAVLAVDGRPVPVYGVRNGRTVIRTMSSVRMTRKNAPIVRVTFDDGTSVRCTPDHQFMLRSGEYRAADQLAVGDSLTRFDSVVTEETGAPRRKVWMGPKGGPNSRPGSGWRLQYRWFGSLLYPGYTGRSGGLIHHVDEDTLNDDHDNLAYCATISDHLRAHWAAMTPQERSDFGKARLAKLTPEQLSERSKKSSAVQTPEQRRARGLKAAAAQTPEERHAAKMRAWETRRKNGTDKWKHNRNHSVVSVVPDGTADVYCGAVEEIENFAIVTTTAACPKSGQLSGVVVHNCDTTGIEPDFALVKHKKLAGGGYLKITNQSVVPALRRLGYSDEQVTRINQYVLEHGHVEGAPVLKPEHVSVFDCAVTAPGGKRSIDVTGHLLMLAAVQPLLSGSVSKTINCPSDFTIDDVRDTYARAHALMLKCVALYRDGSKLSQPLATDPAALLGLDAADPDPPAAKPANAPDPAAFPSLFPAGRAAAAQPGVRKLPDRRRGYTQKLRIGRQKFFLRTGEYEDGTIGEIFLDCDKDGSTLRALLNGWAKMVSLALQNGTPLEEVVDKFLHTKFEPHGLVRGHPWIKSCSSVFDAVARDLGITYLGRTDLAHVTPEGPLRPAAAGGDTTVEPVTVLAAIPEGREYGFLGFACQNPACGRFTMVSDGKCARCASCGTTAGGCGG